MQDCQTIWSNVSHVLRENNFQPRIACLENNEVSIKRMTFCQPLKVFLYSVQVQGHSQSICCNLLASQGTVVMVLALCQTWKKCTTYWLMQSCPWFWNTPGAACAILSAFFCRKYTYWWFASRFYCSLHFYHWIWSHTWFWLHGQRGMKDSSSDEISVFWRPRYFTLSCHALFLTKIFLEYILWNILLIWCVLWIIRTSNTPFVGKLEDVFIQHERASQDRNMGPREPISERDEGILRRMVNGLLWCYLS